jgi:hypothetical protein
MSPPRVKAVLREKRSANAMRREVKPAARLGCLKMRNAGAASGAAMWARAVM